MTNPDAQVRLDAALALQALGWNVVPAAKRGKTPVGSWKRFQTERAPERALREAFSRGEPNVFLVTGAISRLAVLDCDDEASLEWWKEKLGDALMFTARVKTRKGFHFYFRLAEGEAPRGRTRHDEVMDWDLRAEGNGVVAPPSIHETGHVYAWVDGFGPEALKDAPAALFEREPGAEQEGARSMLAHLLASVPASGGRNVWLSKVAGHYALHVPYQDAFDMMVRQAADLLSPPLPDAEIDKLIVSIWNSERAKIGRAVEPPEDGEDDWRRALLEPSIGTGWLVSGGDKILIQVREKQADERWELALDTWMDADLRVLGVVENEGIRSYEIEVRRVESVEIDTLPAETAASSQRLPAWLANHGVSIGIPDNAYPAKMRENTRLIRYLEAQKPRSIQAIPYLGWHDETAAFITHDGVIRATGAVGFETVRPNPSMKNWAKYRYAGAEDLDRARSYLSRVLEFHDETVASVFGAWWAATLLKPQITRLVSQFPFMALEAASESGKTTGYFNLMLQLSGHAGGQSNPTPAAARDALSANRSGSVWLDDLDDLVNHGELLRNVTVGGSMVKKGENNHTQITAKMRASLVVSGEGLGLHGQKALLDRAILLSVPSPVGRLSRSGHPQWEDILELHRECPDLTDVAGGIIRLALQQEGRVPDIKELRTGSGRFADKVAIIRLGVRILAAMCHESWMIEHADAWAESQHDTGSENALTLTLIPEILAVTGWKPKPDGPDEGRRLVPTPVFVDQKTDPGNPVVWFSPMLLEQWLQRNRRGAGSVRLETKQALEDQARAMGLGGSRGVDRKQFRYATGDGKSLYWRCPPPLSRLLLSRSEGKDGEDASEHQDSLLLGD